MSHPEVPIARVTETIDRYCLAWSDPDPDQRRVHLAAVWADFATYTDPNVATDGPEALLSHIGRMQVSRPGAKVVRTTAIDLHHQVARFGFKAIGADGSVLREGMDIAFVSHDGRAIERIIGFFGELSGLST